jgi:hypothetical protein
MGDAVAIPANAASTNMRCILKPLKSVWTALSRALDHACKICGDNQLFGKPLYRGLGGGRRIAKAAGNSKRL